MNVGNKIHVIDYILNDFVFFHSTDFCIESRFVVSHGSETVMIIDLFHSNASLIPMRFDFPLKQERSHNIRTTIFLDLNTVLVFFAESGVNGKEYLGIGKNDTRRITLESVICVDANARDWKLISRTDDANSRDGVYVSYYHYKDARRYALNIKTNQKDQLCPSRPMKLPIGIKEFGLFDGYIYGLLNKPNTNVPDLTEIVKISVESGAEELLATKNSTMLFEDDYEIDRYQMICVGWKLYMSTYLEVEEKSRLVTLDLKTLEWNKTNLEFDGVIQSLRGDRERTLIVVAELDDSWDGPSLYRFIVEQPDSLWNLASMAIKRQSVLSFRYREHILGSLPTNSRFRCPLPVEY